ncbi:hypothetical protein [Geodermatophilus sabuli]|nr:hypothetical protein [Geodermatophilus sabuli]MBB3083088.1 putative lipid-binding transport protein (Tim44 family) [Geodermatophilus sabuli]
MRLSHVATALAAFTAGVTAAETLRRRSTAARPATAATSATVAPQLAVPPVQDDDGVVLPFVRPAAPAPASEQPAAPARCGDSGGRTKAGAPCAARATRGGRCHHHPLAA